LNNEFAKVASTIQMIIQKREERGLVFPFLQLAHTVNERNYNDMQSYVDFWLNKSDALFMGPENYADDVNQNKHYKLEFSPVKPRNSSYRPPCSMIKDHMWIDSEGTAILCIGSKQSIIGNVFDSSITELLESPVRMTVLQEHMNGVYDGSKCQSCEQWYSAYGEMKETEDASIFLSPDTQYYRRKNSIDLSWDIPRELVKKEGGM